MILQTITFTEGILRILILLLRDSRALYRFINSKNFLTKFANAIRTGLFNIHVIKIEQYNSWKAIAMSYLNTVFVRKIKFQKKQEKSKNCVHNNAHESILLTKQHWFYPLNTIRLTIVISPMSHHEINYNTVPVSYTHLDVYKRQVCLWIVPL